LALKSPLTPSAGSGSFMAAAWNEELDWGNGQSEHWKMLDGWKGKGKKGKDAKGKWDDKGKKGKDDKGKGKGKHGKSVDPQRYAAADLVVEKLLGEGASGFCFKGVFQTAPGACVPVAIKPVWNDNEQQIIEILHACKPPLPNIVPVLQVNKPTPAGSVNLMPLASEGTLTTILDNLMRAGLSLNPGDFLEVIARVGEGLAALHKAGILHCDVKPDNIVLHRDAGSTEVWLIDFGDARLADDWSSWAWLGPGDPAVQCHPDVDSGNFSPATDSWELAQCAAMLWAREPWWVDNPAWLQRDMPLFADFCRCLYWHASQRPSVAEIATKARQELRNHERADLTRLSVDRALLGTECN